MPPLTCRIATVADLPGILALQEAYYIGNLAPQARAAGFLSACFDAGQFAQMMGEAGIIVAAGAGGEIAGYLCAAVLAGGHGSPIIARMAELVDEVEYRGRPLRARRLFLYGPVCIHESQRGRGVLQALYAQLRAHLAGRFDTGVAFVARDNPRSLCAHVDKLGMSELCEFAVGEGRYALLAFEVAG